MSRKHQSLFEAYQQVNQGDLRETANIVERMKEGNISILKPALVSESPESSSYIDTDPPHVSTPTPEKPYPHSKQTPRQTGKQTPQQTPRQEDGQEDGQLNRQEDTHGDKHQDGQLNRQTPRQTPEQTHRPWAYVHADLTEAQHGILQYLLSLPKPWTKYTDIQAATGVKYGTIRGSMYALKNKGFLASTGFLRNGDFRGIQVEFTAKAYNYAQTPRQTPEQTGRQTPRHLSEHLDRQEDRHLNEQTSYTKVVVSPTFVEKELLPDRMSWKDFETLCPILLREGYSKTNFDSVIEKWETLIRTGYKLDWGQLVESYRRAEWDAENNGQIESPVAQTFAVLQRGPYGKPKGYVDPIIQALKERVAEIEEAKKLQEHIDQANCEKWWNELPRDEKDKIVSELVKMNKGYQMLPPKSQANIRFDYWLENLKG